MTARPPASLNLAATMLAPALDGHAEGAALLWDTGTLSYGALEASVARHARALRAAGIGRGERVVVLLPDGPALVATFLGALAAGAVPVVLSTRLDDETLDFVLDDSDARALVADSGRLERLATAARLTVACGPPVEGAERYERWLGDGDCALEMEPTDADDMAYWLYTSGTTGRPKAVVHRHRDARTATLHLERNLGLAPGERVFTTSKLFFAYAMGHSLIGGLSAAATVVLHDGWPDAASIGAVVERARPHLFFSVPTLYKRLLDAGHGRTPGFRSVRHFVSAGERLPERLGEQWQAATGSPILEGMGTTETVWLFIANTPSAHRPGATGRVLPWADVRLVAEDGSEVDGAGDPGVLWVRMDSMFSEYWNQRERTLAARDGDWYCTDDILVRDHDGWLYHRGRRGDLFKVSGQWVCIGDIEQAAQELPGVAEATAVGCEGEDGLPRIVLFAVARDGEAGLEQRIVDGLRARLPHHQCPREVRLVPVIPRTETGKPKRHELRNSLGAPPISTG